MIYFALKAKYTPEVRYEKKRERETHKASARADDNNECSDFPSEFLFCCCCC